MFIAVYLFINRMHQNVVTRGEITGRRHCRRQGEELVQYRKQKVGRADGNVHFCCGRWSRSSSRINDLSVSGYVIDIRLYSMQCWLLYQASLATQRPADKSLPYARSITETYVPSPVSPSRIISLWVA